ncbi:MAG: hypothetical protein CTY30_00855 [Methylocystis sp.]|nr:MAG: hypothetical protein CTY30_00855 [Methylocystis sp.]
MTKRSKAAHRRLASWILADLTRLAAVQRAGGKKLDVASWLIVGGNILSSAPVGAGEGGRSAPERFGLDYGSLLIFAQRCGLESTAADIQRQVAATMKWRAAESARIGRAHHAPMAPDTIGRLLGVTEDDRRAARAWRIGTIGGSKEARAEAAKERDRARKAQKRREAGMSKQAHSLSRIAPWKALGMSKATWYRRGKPGETTLSETTLSVHNKCGETTLSVHNIEDTANASARSALEADCSISDAEGDISAGDSLPAPAADAAELAERLRRMRAEPAPPRPPLPPGGLAARALATIRKPQQGAGALGRARPGVGKVAAE